MIARRGQQRRHIDVAVNVIRPAVQEEDDGAIGWAGFGIADSEGAGLGLLEGSERGIRSRPDVGQVCRRLRAGLRRRSADADQLGGSNAGGRSHEKTASGGWWDCRGHAGSPWLALPGWLSLAVACAEDARRGGVDQSPIALA